MSLQSFYDKLEKVKDQFNWVIVPHTSWNGLQKEFIRGVKKVINKEKLEFKHNLCPLEAVFGISYYEEGEADSYRHIVIASADQNFECQKSYSEEVRNQLLERLGL